MNKSINSVLVFALVTAFVGSIAMPASALNIIPRSKGENRVLSTTTSTTTREKVQLSFCSRIANMESGILNAVGKRTDDMKKKHDDRGDKLSTTWEKQNKKLDDERAHSDQKRDDMYERLEAKATTDSQKAAVETFKKTVELAISVRREAVTAALDIYRKGVESLVQKHETDLSQKGLEFKTAVSAAFEKAKADCAAGVSLETVKDNLKKSIDTARDTFNQGRKDINYQEELKTLKDAREVAVKNAISTFETSVKSAKEILKIALGGVSGNATSSN